MARLIIELTDRCNLRCRHCFEDRHAGTADLSLDTLRKVLQEGKSCGFDEVSFTGGEPTLHRQFAEILRLVCEAGYRFGFVSNGSNFSDHYLLLVDHREWFSGVTFSLDGAHEATHDRLRGNGSYRQVTRAASICMYKELPFTLNMVLTAENRGEVREIVELGASLGCGGVRFGHLMSTPETTLRGLDLSPQQRLEVENEIWRLKESAPILVAMAPGYFSESAFFPCAPLKLQELNLDCRGNVTLCCQLSGYSGGANNADFMGNLGEVSLAEAVDRSRRMVAAYLAEKQAKLTRGEFKKLDHFPCWYCLKYLGKTSWIKDFPHHPWADNESFTAARAHGNA